MIITDLYHFEKLSTKSAARFDCTTSTHSHPELEGLRNATETLFIYLGNVPARFNGNVKRKADKSLTNRLGKNLSSLFMPDLTKSVCYGDIAQTNDLIIVKFTPDIAAPTIIELFVCRGQKNNGINIYNLFADGELDSNIDQLKERLC
jgi:archaellin